MAQHPEHVALVHIDADLHSSTATVLEHVGDRLCAGSVIVRDDEQVVVRATKPGT